jgi:ribose 1,5-bisphosphokinase
MAQGKLYYVVGASGSGKDSLLDYARQRVDRQSKPILFIHRYLTRKGHDEHENYISLSDKEFEQRKQLGLFAMHWSSHDCSYGIGMEMDLWLDQGIDVVVNGSRAYLPQAMDRYPTLIVIIIQVSEHLLRQRLIDRGRESPEEIEERLQKAAAYDLSVAQDKVRKVQNEGELEQAGELFLQIITQS